MTTVKEEEETEEDEYLCKFRRSITPVWWVLCLFLFCFVFVASRFYLDSNSTYKTLGGETQSVRRVIVVDEDNEVFQKKPIKEEEPEDDDFLCKPAGTHEYPHDILRMVTKNVMSKQHG